MYCSQCGAENADAAAVCAQCGQTLVTVPAAAMPDAPTVFSSFWIRVGASMIDGVIVMGAFVVLIFVLVLSVLMPPLIFLLIVLVWILSIVGPWLYFAMFESSAWQATPGKRAVGIKVTDVQGNRISFGRATGRHFAEWITGMTLFVGYVMVAFTQKRQSLHDMIAGTVVVGAGVEPGQVATAPPAKPMSAWGIAGIFLLGFVLVVGMIAAIAIPAYQEFTIRAQVTEGLVLTSDIKGQVEMKALESGRWPANLADLEFAPDAAASVESSHYVSEIEISNGTITITYGQDVHPSIQRKRLSLRPYVTESGEVQWLCGRAAEPPDAYFSLEDGAPESDLGTTNLQDEVLPANCRTGYVPTDEFVES